jgi:ribonucleoside-diphosphate reductase alpha chain
MTAFHAPISSQIWDMKYRLKTPEGAPVDQTVEDSWRRVARALAAAEPEDQRTDWENRFHAALDGFRFLPAGRILAGAGTGRLVTLFNCFVMGTIPDSLEGIFEMLKEAAITMQQGGGIGFDFTTIRPKGAPVAGVGADASGPLSFMDVWDAMCRTIMSAGSRRGAMMATMRCDHPDIEDFIAAKHDAARLRMFNLSVLATDAFMQAIEDDAPWDLQFDGRIFRTVPARDLWNRIMRATYDYAEPGVIFIDRINRNNNLHYAETISATNPCVTADTWVATAEGPRQVTDLTGRPFTALVNGKPHASGPQGFFATGRKPVLRLATACGRALRLTAEHPVRTVTSRTRWRVETVWRKAGDLRPGDEIMLHDHANAEWLGKYSADEGYLIGLLVGDGTIKSDKTVLSVWRPAASVVNGAVNGGPAPDPVMARVEAAARALPHRADFAGWMEVPGRGEWRLSTAELGALAAALDLAPGAKTVTPAIERQSAEFYRGFLGGLFDADGSVQGSQAKGVSVRLAQSDLPALEAVQRMLARLGIIARIYANRRPAGHAVLPDGKGGQRAYATAAQHELVIAGANLIRFNDRVGFEDPAKAARLTAALAGYSRALNRERFTATIAAVEPDGEARVFDVQVPGVNAFDANGIMVHNCGEQPLPPYGACLLGSINLAALVRDPFEAAAALDQAELTDLVATAIRMMDNVVDVSRFPLEAQRAEARAKRRIGLGVTGLADALLMTGLRYGSADAVAQTGRWMQAVQHAAYRASVDLAREKGAFPLFDRDEYLKGEVIRDLPRDIRDGIAAHGIRNALVTSIAPTGTISLFAGNVSSGIEPVFAYAYTRKVLMPDGSRTEEEVVDYAVAKFREKFGAETPLPEYFANAQTLAPMDHVRMQAEAQKHIDSSISKTINVPADIDFEAFKDVYVQAYLQGCKGCTTYRPNAVTGSVLEARDPVEKVETLAVTDTPRHPGNGEVVYISEPLERPETLMGQTYKLKWPDSPHAMYITMNDTVVSGRQRPFEIFINSKNMEHYAWTVALTRMVSAVFRRGGDVSFVVEELKAVFDPRGGAWMKGRYVPSILAAIGGVIERHMVEIGFIEGEGMGLATDPAAEAVAVGEARMSPATCPACGSYNTTLREGCAVCLDCGHSKCG